MSDDCRIFFPTLPHKELSDKELPNKELIAPLPARQEREEEAIESAVYSADILHLGVKREGKHEDALRTIGETAELLDLPVHVVRFWQARFSEISPIKRSDGRGYYRPQDIALLRGLRRLLHEEGYTIKGVHRLIRKKGVDFVCDKGEREIADHDDRLNQILYGLLTDLQHIQERIKKLVA